MKTIFLLILIVWSSLFAADILTLVKTLDQNDTSRFKTMVRNAIDANAARKDNNKSILMYASWVGNDEAVRYLIEKGAQINAEDSGGATALHLALWKDHTNIALYLIERGASVRALSIDGMTPIDIAVLRQNKQALDAIDRLAKPIKPLLLD